ncbi:MAG: hypothetical protein SFW09_18920 [Hyphomicrobiaceae bacterium]|nr:hypothetical protein [Hyphomicrobiaceae bacterium]
MARIGRGSATFEAYAQNMREALRGAAVAQQLSPAGEHQRIGRELVANPYARTVAQAGALAMRRGEPSAAERAARD